jgi:hypothetical protein
MNVVEQTVLGGIFAMSSCLLLTAQSNGASAGTAAETQPQISFKFERAGVPVSHFIIQIHEDGTGNYQADVTPGIGGGSPVAAQLQHVNRTITLTPATTAKLFHAAREQKSFNIDCASKAKNIADTGAKTLSYSGADGKGSCVYNYSENKDVAAATDTFLAIAFTLDEGRRLSFLHRFDRLGLDAEMGTLSEEAKAGRALELGTIAPTLSSIAADTEVMERVRRQAAKLLEQAK